MKKTIRQLSDDKLEDACGGSSTGGKSYYRLVCDKCNYKSWWSPKKAEQTFLVDLHKMGCNGVLRLESQYFESDPNLWQSN